MRWDVETARATISGVDIDQPVTVAVSTLSVLILPLFFIPGKTSFGLS